MSASITTQSAAPDTRTDEALVSAFLAGLQMALPELDGLQPAELDSVLQTMDEPAPADSMVDLKVASAQLTRDEMKDVSKYLTPVQRARLLVMRERFMERVREHGHGEGGGRRHPRDRSQM